MSYANGTTHYNLPQTTGTDKRDWSDTNQAFQDIDAALYQATQDTAQAALDIDALEVRMDTAEQNIATNAGDISALDGRVTTVEGTVTQHTTQIGDVRTDLEDMICAYNEASATSTHAYDPLTNKYFIYNDVLYRATASIAVGDTIVPDTNCTTTNVTAEISDAPLYTTLSDGVKTLETIYRDIFNNIVDHDLTKRKLVVDYGTRKIVFDICDFGSEGSIRFTHTDYGTGYDTLDIEIITMLSDSAKHIKYSVAFTASAISGGNVAYVEATIPTSGIRFTVL